MDFFQNLVKGIKNKKEQKTDVSNVIDYLESLILDYKGFIELQSTKEDVFDFIQNKLHRNTISKNIKNKKMLDVYRSGISILKIDSQDIFIKTSPILKNIILKDLELIVDNFKSLFSNVKSMNELRLSHTYIIGYATLAEKFINCLKYIIFVLNTEKGSSNSTPRYLINEFERDFINSCNFIVKMFGMRKKSKHKTIMHDVKGLSDKGRDFILLNKDGTTISDFVDITKYNDDIFPVIKDNFTDEIDEDIRSGGRVLDRQIFYRIMTSLSTVRYSRHTKRQSDQKWLEQKIEVLQMDMLKLDQDSPKYIRSQKLLNNYIDLASKNKQKIDKYLSDEGELEDY